jgi:hypothetical protein
MKKRSLRQNAKIANRVSTQYLVRRDQLHGHCQVRPGCNKMNLGHRGPTPRAKWRPRTYRLRRRKSRCVSATKRRFERKTAKKQLKKRNRPILIPVILIYDKTEVEDLWQAESSPGQSHRRYPQNHPRSSSIKRSYLVQRKKQSIPSCT